eukprot:2189186-Prymnesium_polylepis.2
MPIWCAAQPCTPLELLTAAVTSATFRTRVSSATPSGAPKRHHAAASSRVIGGADRPSHRDPELRARLATLSKSMPAAPGEGVLAAAARSEARGLLASSARRQKSSKPTATACAPTVPSAAPITPSCRPQTSRRVASRLTAHATRVAATGGVVRWAPRKDASSTTSSSASGTPSARAHV